MSGQQQDYLQDAVPGLRNPWLCEGLSQALGLIVIFALAFAVYYPALRERLVADDFILVGHLSFDGALRYFHETLGFGRNEYRPLTAMSYGVDQWLWQGNPAGYHLTNLVLHALASGLFFLALYALSAEFFFSLFAAGIFVIHPIDHARINWITARDGSVCAVFLLGAVWLYILSRKRNSQPLHIFAVLSATCALLAYEGAIILFLLLYAIECLFLAAGPLRSRTASSLKHIAWFAAVTAAYLCLWQIVFSGKIGAYDLSLSPIAILRNYTRLWAALFQGWKLPGIAALYLILLGLSYRYLRARWKMTVLAVAFVFIAFIPYCFTRGFDSRFGYISALGMAILLALCCRSSSENHRHLHRAVIACAGVALCSWYAVEDRRIIKEWTTAGEIAHSIPQAVRKLHPVLPPGTVLVFTGIPVTYRRANVFPTGLDAAIQQQYPVPVVVRQLQQSLENLSEEAGALVFEYHGGDNSVREIAATPHPSSRPTAVNSALPGN